MGVIAGSFLYKLPQILKIQKAKSVEGIPLSSLYLQLIMPMVTMSLFIHSKAPVINYLENISIFAQSAIVVMQHWKFYKNTSTGCIIGSTIFFIGIGYALLGDILPDQFYLYIATINIILLLAASVP